MITLYFVSGTNTTWNSWCSKSFICGLSYGVCLVLLVVSSQMADLFGKPERIFLCFPLSWGTVLIWNHFLPSRLPGWIYNSWICHCCLFIFIRGVWFSLTSWNINNSTQIIFYAEFCFLSHLKWGSRYSEGMPFSDWIQIKAEWVLTLTSASEDEKEWKRSVWGTGCFILSLSHLHYHFLCSHLLSAVWSTGWCAFLGPALSELDSKDWGGVWASLFITST